MIQHPGGELDAATTPVVSVVMSVLNGERFLREAVDSILSQTFSDFELIIINDGSTDDTADILDAYQHADPRVRVVHQANHGLVASLNHGCGLARGKYIARMDADDIAVPDRLMRQGRFMEEHPEVAVVGGSVEVINGAGKSLVTYHNATKDSEIQSSLFRGSPFWHPSVLMRKEAFAAVGGYRKIVVDAEDYDLWLRIAERYQLANLEQVVLKYRRHPGQVSVRKCRQQALSSKAAIAAARSRRNGGPDLLDAAEEITQETLAALGVSSNIQETYLARLYVSCIDNMSDAGEYAAALETIETVQSFDWKHAETAVIADFRLSAARLYWRRKRFAKSILTVGHAFLTRPIMLGRPFKGLLHRMRLAAQRP